ncbi:putative 2OG-Fe(II) oxygenase family oxidoreductase [Xylariaceae sp. FL0594]|nr:putative 2OG-Fe(II) oxygenase family oxidoreductase [Xylariaceae sp. FL0594]
MSTTTTTTTAPTFILPPEAPPHPGSTPEYSVISYAKLLSKSPSEIAALRTACERDGFFYLNLRGSQGDAGEDKEHTVEDKVPRVFKIVNEFFKLDDEEKMSYDIDTIAPWKLHGYTPFGRNSGLAGGDKKHGVEAYTLPRDGLSPSVPNQAPVPLPPVLASESPFLTGFMEELHGISLDILHGLDLSRSPSPSSNSTSTTESNFFTSRHRPTEPSTTCLLLIRYATLDTAISGSGLAPHTDVGSITLLFASEKGLQARHPLTHEWRFLEPREGCAVVNVGDSLRFLSGKEYQSSLHRVIPPTSDGSRVENRFSCAYFLRPELDAEFTAEGKRWKSLDWHMRKYKSYRSGQTGKTE